MLGWGLMAVVAAQSLTEDLGKYERQALAEALRVRGLAIEPMPESKRVGAIHVVNLPVFTQAQDGFLTFANALHVTTKEFIIAREVLLRPGMEWDEALVFETKRNLRDPLFTTLVVAVPVVSGEPNTVDLLVITRDVWSLRLNTSLQFQQSSVTNASIVLAENNLLGLRKRIAARFDLTQGNFSIGPEYDDRNVRGSWMRLFHGSGLIFARSTGALEGSRSTTQLELPLYALDRLWGWRLDVVHSDRVSRSFIGTELRTYDNPDSDELETIPRAFRAVDVDVEGSVVRSFPGRITHRVRAGYRVAWDAFSSELPSGTEPDDISAFDRDVLGRSELRSGPFVAYGLFERTFRIFRNIQTFDFPEDVRVGPSVELIAVANPRLLGSDVDSMNFAASAAWRRAFGSDSYGSVSAAISGRMQGGRFIDIQLSSDLFWASPSFGPLGRFVLNGDLDALEKETRNRFFELGGDLGLRGYPVGAFTGDRRVIINAEFRSAPVRAWFLRLGGVLFLDLGHAWDVNLGVSPEPNRERTLDLRANAGVGVRFVVPQTNTAVWRIDWAFAADGPTSGWPGRLSGGLTQYF